MPAATPRPAADSSTRAFRAVAYFEAASYLVLLAATFVHRVLDGPDAVSVLGPIHGVAFLVYFALAVSIRDEQGWSVWQTIVVLLAASVPFGGFWAGRHLKTEERQASATA